MRKANDSLCERGIAIACLGGISDASAEPWWRVALLAPQLLPSW